MYPFNRIWFWLLFISLILIIISLVSFSFYGNIKNLKTTPLLITLTFIMGVVFLIISFIAYLVSSFGFNNEKPVDLKMKQKLLETKIGKIIEEKLKKLKQKSRRMKSKIRSDKSKKLCVEVPEKEVEL